MNSAAVIGRQLRQQNTGRVSGPNAPPTSKGRARTPSHVPPPYQGFPGGTPPGVAGGNVQGGSSAKKEEEKKSNITWACIWRAFKVLSSGILIFLGGVAMTAVGFMADQLATEVVVQGNSTEEILNETVQMHLHNLSYLGPVIMGIGGIVLVAACVFAFGIQDTGRVRPARQERPSTAAVAVTELSGYGIGNALMANHIPIPDGGIALKVLNPHKEEDSNPSTSSSSSHHTISEFGGGKQNCSGNTCCPSSSSVQRNNATKPGCTTTTTTTTSTTTTNNQQTTTTTNCYNCPSTSTVETATVKSGSASGNVVRIPNAVFNKTMHPAIPKVITTLPPLSPSTRDRLPQLTLPIRNKAGPFTPTEEQKKHRGYFPPFHNNPAPRLAHVSSGPTPSSTTSSESRFMNQMRPNFLLSPPDGPPSPGGRGHLLSPPMEDFVPSPQDYVIPDPDGCSCAMSPASLYEVELYTAPVRPFTIQVRMDPKLFASMESDGLSDSEASLSDLRENKRDFSIDGFDEDEAEQNAPLLSGSSSPNSPPDGEVPSLKQREKFPLLRQTAMEGRLQGEAT